MEENGNFRVRTDAGNVNQQYSRWITLEDSNARVVMSQAMINSPSAALRWVQCVAIYKAPLHSSSYRTSQKRERYLFSMFLPSGHGGCSAPSHTQSLVVASLLPSPPSQGARGSDYGLASRRQCETLWRKCKCRLTPTTLYDREKGLLMETREMG